MRQKIYDELVNEKTQSEIAKTLGVTKAYISRITKQFKEENLIKCYNENSNPKKYYPTLPSLLHLPIFSKHIFQYKQKFDWTKEQKEIIDGELLGDGSIDKDFRFTISVISKEHILYLKNNLPQKIFSKSNPYLRKPKNKKWKTNHCLASRVSQFFCLSRYRWYPLGTKIVPNNLVLTPTNCFHWYIGDGYFRRSCIILATDCFNKNDVDFLVSQLSNLGFNIISRKYNHSFRIVIKQPQSFLEWIGKPKIDFYKYKWGIDKSQQTSQLSYGGS